MTFHELFRRPGRFGEPDPRSGLFPAVVAESQRLRLWQPGMPFATSGPRLLTGVATWSGYDMNLLDLIEAAEAFPVDVYDVDTVTPNPAGQDDYIPGASGFLQVPFVGFWRDGVLVETADGHRANRLVERVCRLDPAEVSGAMATVLTRF